MKRSPLICALSFALALALAPLAQAVERIPVQTMVCYPATGLANWTYRASGNTFNGAPEHKGYIFLNFNRYRTPDGHIVQENVQHAVNGLEWDANFNNIIAPGLAGETPVTCASMNQHGVRRVRKNERNCRLEGRIIPAGNCPAVCGDQPAYLFDGELLISRE